jgi:hypothetical protein
MEVIGDILQRGDSRLIEEAYRVIRSEALRAEVDQVLIDLATDMRGDLQVVERCCHAIELTARLRLSGATAALKRVKSAVGEPTSHNEAIRLQAINRALVDYPIAEGEEFLSSQLDHLPAAWFELVSNLDNAPNPKFQQYLAAGIAFEALKKLNPSRASQYANKFGLPEP